MEGEGLTSAPAAAPAAAGGGGATPSAPATSSGSGTGAPASTVHTPSLGLSPLSPPSFEAPAEVAATPELAPPPEAATVAATPEEFPGDDAFAQLSGQERASHWQQARARIAELNQQVA